MENLSKFQSITKNLQLKGIITHGVRYVFSGVVIDYSSMAQYLQPYSKMMNNTNFESGLVKITNKEFSSMSRSEKLATIGMEKVTGGEEIVVIKNTDPAATLNHSGSVFEMLVMKKWWIY